MSRRGRRPGGGPFIESSLAPGLHLRPLGETVAYLEVGGLEVRHVQVLPGSTAFCDGRMGGDQIPMEHHD